MEQLSAFYVGSFDPFHFGHYEIVNYLLENYKTVYILPNAPSKSKPNRVNLQHRLNIIKCYFPNISNLHILLDQADEFVKQFDPTKTIGIMGSDAYNKLIIKGALPKLPIFNWLIVQRDGDVCLPSTVEKFSVKILDSSVFNQQMFSSTIARNELTNIGTCNCMSVDAIVYCNLFGLYDKTTLTSNFITENYVIVKKMEITRGIKLYFNCNERYLNSLKGYEILQSKLDNLVVPVTTHLGTYLSVMIFDKTSGQNITSIVNSDLHQQVGLYEIGKKIGTKLKLLHSTNTIPFDELDKQQNPIINKIGSEHFEQIKLLYNKCYLHGDLSINNICYDFDTKDVYFIDPEKSPKYVSYEKNNIGPCGIAYYEYCQFISSIAKYSSKHITEHLLDGFIDGYEHIELFEPIFVYWCNKGK